MLYRLLKLCQNNFKNNNKSVLRYRSRKRVSATAYLTSLRSFVRSGIEVFTDGETPYKSLATYQVISNVSEGHRCPCPDTCPPIIYRLFLRCWDLEPDKVRAYL